MARTTAIPPAAAMQTTSTSPHCSGKTAGRRGAIDLRRKRLHIGQNLRVEDAFGYVLFAVVIVAAIVALISLRGERYDHIGRGGLFEDDDPRPRGPAGSVPMGSAAERDEEIRQMLGARNERRAARGEAPLDVDEEVARLTRPAFDPALVAEIRSLVEAKNERRARRGQPPLDVEAEVRRQISDLSG